MLLLLIDIRIDSSRQKLRTYQLVAVVCSRVLSKMIESSLYKVSSVGLLPGKYNVRERSAVNEVTTSRRDL